MLFKFDRNKRTSFSPSAIFLFSLILAVNALSADHDTTANEPVSKTQAILETVFDGQTIKLEPFSDQLSALSVGSNHLFVSRDGRYIFGGPIYDTHKKVDIVAEQQAIFRKKLIDEQDSSLFVSYPEQCALTRTLTVVTDIDCPYCRSLHRTLNELNQRGVCVNYLMLPRAGVGSMSYKKTLSAFCSNNPAESITKAMLSEEAVGNVADCDKSRLDQHMKLARTMNIRSTPSFVLPNGQLSVGLLSPPRILQLLDQNEVATKEMVR